MRFRHYFLAAPLLALCTAPALAQTGDRDERFRDWDSNRDGILQKAEFRGHPGNFDAMDANHDRVLSRDEFVQRYRMDDTGPTHNEPVRGRDQFAGIDTDNDDFVSLAEWRGSPLNLPPVDFEVYDANDDGRVTRAEYVFIVDRASRPTQFADRDLNNDGFLAQGEWASAEPVSFGRVDRNGDGRVSWSEYRNPVVADSRFEEMDRDRDGVLSRREMGTDRATFDRLDRNNNDVVTRQEYENPRGENNLRAEFDELDRNNDRAITLREWQRGEPAFARLDQNNDGQLTFGEFDDTRANDPRFRRLDRNRDGWVTRGEWRESRSAFSRLDRNRDGRLSALELR